MAPLGLCPCPDTCRANKAAVVATGMVHVRYRRWCSQTPWPAAGYRRLLAVASGMAALQEVAHVALEGRHARDGRLCLWGAAAACAAACSRGGGHAHCPDPDL